jgi:hypothetical protein
MAPLATLERGWHRSLGELVEQATAGLLVAAPFITAEGSRMLVEKLSPTIKATGRLHLLTDLNPAHVCDGSLEPSALGSIVDAVPVATLWHIPRLHAKVYVADRVRAIVTSGNLTAGAFYRNLEYGVDIRDLAIVSDILDHFEVFQATGATVSREQLAKYVAAAEQLRETFVRQQRSASSAATKALREAMQDAEDDLVRLRLAGGAMHTVFGRTIGYLLRKHGPMSTVQLHKLIHELHPDLCDDSVDRVIDGQSFGKKWKHAVRTAQQDLKKKGEITHAEGVWQSLLSPLK